MNIEASGKTILLSDSDTPPVADLAKVEGVAYNGGFIRQEWDSRNMVVDLAGMELSPQIPLLLSHMNWPGCRLGVVTAANDGVRLTVSGGIDVSDKDGSAIVSKGRKFDWQLSIGADVIEAVAVPENEERSVNGRDLKGPFLLIVRSKLREVSVVAVGADPETHLRIAASFKNMFAFEKNSNFLINQSKGESEMENKENLLGDAVIQSKNGSEEMGVKVWKTPEPSTEGAPSLTDARIEAAAQAAAENAVKLAREGENARIEAVKNITADYPELRERAISSGWSPEYTQSVVDGVKAAMSGIPQASGNIIVRSGPSVDARALEAALCLQCGISESVIEASCGKQAIDIADSHLRGIGLKDVVVEAARLSGKSVGVGFSNDTIRAGFSSADLGGILSNVANKKALQAFEAQESIAAQLCSAGDLADFKESERYRLTDLGDLEIVSEGGEIKSGSLGEDKATNKLDTYGKVFTLTRQMIYNDDLGEFLKIPTAMGTRAKRKIDQVFFTRLLANPIQSDGKALFSSEHLNFKSGTNTALSVDSLEKAIALFLDQVDSDGQPIAVSPKFLLVPTNLYPTAQRLTISALLIGGDSVAPAQNVISNYGLTPVASPYLANAKYAGNSDTGFYLFANPNQVDTFEIGYFQGRRTPTVEKGYTDFDTLGMGFRVYFDFGVREQDHRGMVFFKGKQ